MAAGGKRVVAIFIGRIDVIQRILAATNIERIAVRQKHLATLILDQIHHDFCVVGTQVGQIAGFAKMDLDGRILVIEIDTLQHAGLLDQARQLLGQVLTGSCTKIGKIYLGCHIITS